MSDRPAPAGMAPSNTRRSFIQSAAAVAGGLAVSPSVWTRKAAAQTTKKTDLVIAQAGDISKLDPHLSTAGFDVTVSFNLYDHLVSRRRDNKLYPSLASSWSAVQPTIWQFKLRPGVKFHNGDPFTSAELNGSPLWNFTPGRSLNCQVVGCTALQLSAKDGCSLLSRCRLTRLS